MLLFGSEANPILSTIIDHHSPQKIIILLHIRKIRPPIIEEEEEEEEASDEMDGLNIKSWKRRSVIIRVGGDDRSQIPFFRNVEDTWKAVPRTDLSKVATAKQRRAASTLESIVTLRPNHLLILKANCEGGCNRRVALCYQLSWMERSVVNPDELSLSKLWRLDSASTNLCLF